MAFVAAEPTVVVLAPEPAGLYFVGKWHGRVEPARVTIALTVGAVTHVGIIGFRPGGFVFVAGRGPKWKVRVKTGWGVDVKVGGHGHGRFKPGKGHGHGRGHGGGRWK